MAQDLYGFDEQSVRRIGKAVRADEANQPGMGQDGSPPVNRLQIHTFVRDTPDPLDSVTATTFDGVLISTEYEYDFDALDVTCEAPRKTLPESAPRWEVSQDSFMEGCVFHGDLFQAVNIGGKWHAIGTAHTAVNGTYDTTDDTLVIDDCNRQKVPVQVAIAGFTLEDGLTYVAEWVRAARIYVVTASGCTEE